MLNKASVELAFVLIRIDKVDRYGDSVDEGVQTRNLFVVRATRSSAMILYHTSER